MAPTDHLGRELNEDSGESGPQTVSEFAEQNPDPSDLSENIREVQEQQRERREEVAAAERGDAAAEEQSRDDVPT